MIEIGISKVRIGDIPKTGAAEMAREISGERKTAYYLGMTLMVIGFLLFFSVFFSTACQMLRLGGGFGGGDDLFSSMPAMMGSMAFRAIGGMLLIIIGSAIRGIGARGLAGSGVLLDPQRAREELEPFSRQGGGMLKDALDEANIDLSGGIGRPAPPERVIMVKCRHCGQLNEEDSKFCQECGKEI